MHFVCSRLLDQKSRDKIDCYTCEQYHLQYHFATLWIQETRIRGGRPAAIAGFDPVGAAEKKIKYAARIFFPLALVCPARPALPPASQWRPKTAGVDVGYSAARAPSHTLRPAPYRYLPRLTRMCNSASVHVARRGQPHVRAGGSGHAPLATTIGTPVATLLHALLTCPPVPPPVPLL
jgi:hypothetical protein